jgi:hypothetical protein
MQKCSGEILTGMMIGRFPLIDLSAARRLLAQLSDEPTMDHSGVSPRPNSRARRRLDHWKVPRRRCEHAAGRKRSQCRRSNGRRVG